MATTKKTTTKKTAPKKATQQPAEDKKKELVEQQLKKVTSFGPDFVKFIREQGIVGLAVGLAIGTAAGASVKVIVEQFISPLVALLTRGVDLTNLKWVLIAETATQPEVAIGWGAIVSSLITLVATAFVIFWLVHVAKLDKLDKKKGA